MMTPEQHLALLAAIIYAGSASGTKAGGSVTPEQSVAATREIVAEVQARDPFKQLRLKM